MPKPQVYTRNSPPQGGDLAIAARRLLAEGDSWFTLGTLNLAQGTNLLLELEFEDNVAVMSWAYPGDTLQRMVDGTHDPDFDRALWNRDGGNFASFWEAIVLSAGGNDLICAAEVRPRIGGRAVDPARRLFLTAAESSARGDVAGPLRHISDAGWQTLADHLLANFRDLLACKARGPSARSPVVLHTYAPPAARPVGAGLSSQGWLYPAMQAYGIPRADMQAVCDELFGRLRRFLLSLDATSGSPLALPGVRVFDSAGLATIEPAVFEAPGISGDWVNEIHLTKAGYRKMGPPFGRFIEAAIEDEFGPP